MFKAEIIKSKAETRWRTQRLRELGTLGRRDHIKTNAECRMQNAECSKPKAAQ
jgi:hypothetical protein